MADPLRVAVKEPLDHLTEVEFGLLFISAMVDLYLIKEFTTIGKLHDQKNSGFRILT